MVDIDIPESDDPIYYDGETREELIGGQGPARRLSLQITPDRIRLVKIHEANRTMRRSELEGVLLGLPVLVDMRKLRSWTEEHAAQIQNGEETPEPPTLRAIYADDLVDGYREGGGLRRVVGEPGEYDDPEELARALFEENIQDGYYTPVSEIEKELQEVSLDA
jgi:hypothetical protein